MNKLLFEILYIGSGGLIGALARYFSYHLIGKIFNLQRFPYATFIINIIGCFFIGIIAGLLNSLLKSNEIVKAFFILGFLGSYTTFSTFAYETYKLLEAGRIIASFANIFLQALIGIIGVWLGISLTKFFAIQTP
ncbi:MAG: fluoride efflux transporter CrcB [Deltaproteobacteria bacterium]|nr:fluoride efflux transporter CrcB [Deltaproteobacteria bacterium]